MVLAELKRNGATKHAAETVSWAHDALSLSFEEIGTVVEADERTVRRWRGEETAPRARHQASLEAFVDLRHLLDEVFESPQEATAWLHTGIKAFRGHPPIKRIREGRIKDVVGVLATMESGAFV